MQSAELHCIVLPSATLCITAGLSISPQQCMRCPSSIKVPNRNCSPLHKPFRNSNCCPLHKHLSHSNCCSLHKQLPDSNCCTLHKQLPHSTRITLIKHTAPAQRAQTLKQTMLMQYSHYSATIVATRPRLRLQHASLMATATERVLKHTTPAPCVH